MKNAHTFLLAAVMAFLGFGHSASIAQQKDEQPITIKKGDAISPPRVVSAPNPKLPPKGVYGTVVIEGTVGTDGKLHGAKIKRSLSRENDASALDAVQEWRFEPAKKAGSPVAVRTSVEVAFFPDRR